jgi:hypothetical protein
VCGLPLFWRNNNKTGFLAMSKQSNILKAIFLFALLSLSENSAWAQQNLLDTLSEKFNLYRQKNLQEKLYVHLDRTNFITGETMWFSIYCVNGTTHRSLAISKVAYIEILDRNNKPVVQGKVELKNSAGNGSLFIPASLNSGSYTVRAYTSWMKNSNPEFYFHQAISIINPFRDPEKAKDKPSANYDAQFLPEGGYLVDGIPGTVGYRVTNATGRGIDFKGCVINSARDTLVRFSPKQFGIGSFSITPSATETYTVLIREKDGVTQSFPLPQVHKEGYAIHLEREIDNINIHVSGKFENLTSPFVYLFVHTRNQVIHSEMRFLANGKTVFTLDKRSFSEGLSHITLFNSELHPVCERLYFRTPENSLRVKINSDNATYGSRKKVKLSVSVNDQASLPQNTSLSLSVFKMDSLPFTQQKDILPYLLLTSDLHGEIESPESYFKPGAEELTEGLMLTHGWRRFSWDKVFSNQSLVSLYMPELQGHLVRGKVLDEAGNPAGNVKTFLSYASRKINLSATISNQSGDVQYVLKDFKGTQRLILQTDLTKDSTHKIIIDNPFSTAFANPPMRTFILEPSSKRGLSLRSIAMQVQDVFHEDQFLPDGQADSSAFYGKADETYFLDNFTRFPVMEEVMREYVPGVWVRKRKEGFYLMVADKTNDKVFQGDPLMLMDGVPIFDVDRLLAFDPLKVKKLEVITRLYFLGNMTFPGIVSYSTYAGDLAGFPIHPKSMAIDYEGLQQTREFYSPQYENEKLRNSRIPDQRHLLYWQPNLEVKNGVAEVEFYTSDLTGEFKVQVQGLTPSGLMGSGTHGFSVKRFDN